jgi:hypothetical protein
MNQINNILGTPLFIPLENFLFHDNEFNFPNLNILNQLGNLDLVNNNYHLVILTNKNQERNVEIENQLQAFGIFANTIINNVNGLNGKIFSPLLQPIQNRFFRNEVLFIRDNDIDILNRF